MRGRKLAVLIPLSLVALLVWVPLWLMLTGPLMGAGEASQNLSPVLGGVDGKAAFPLIARYPTLRPFVELLFDSPEFFATFRNSCVQVIPAVLGQVIVGAPAAWALARYRFRGRRFLRALYIALMLMPFQVTMVSNFLVLDRLRLMDTHWAMILPAAASTFPVFIMTRSFAALPDSMCEAASLDGAGDFQIFLRVGLPLGVPGIMSAVVLGFIELWNAVEQPLSFLRTKSLYPLALYLPSITVENIGISLAASVIALMPALLIFLFGQTWLEAGISTAGLKE